MIFKSIGILFRINYCPSSSESILYILFTINTVILYYIIYTIKTRLKYMCVRIVYMSVCSELIEETGRPPGLIFGM